MRCTAQCIIETVVEDDSLGTECLLSNSEFQPSNFSKTAKDIKLRILANFINVCHRYCFYFLLSYQMQASALIRRSFVENIPRAINHQRLQKPLIQKLSFRTRSFGIPAAHYIDFFSFTSGLSCRYQLVQFYIQPFQVICICLKVAGRGNVILYTYHVYQPALDHASPPTCSSTQ